MTRFFDHETFKISLRRSVEIFVSSREDTSRDAEWNDLLRSATPTSLGNEKTRSPERRCVQNRRILAEASFGFNFQRLGIYEKPWSSTLSVLPQ
ncbi:uncharacterized protein LOC112493710 [Cephus cinctus]|uniref:Uncharacterized protein LOC112493710 n=1 Tax=Cephus cinctus TaxID=211228 RepID=A0AAJ7R889_CEPCN|nr:uncharacterized protein LOC112493710 [Cephus cinctus]